MDHQITGFIDDKNIVIFINNIQRDSLRFPARRFFDNGLYLNGFTAKHFFFGHRRDPSVHPHLAVKDPGFYPRS